MLKNEFDKIVIKPDAILLSLRSVVFCFLLFVFLGYEKNIYSIYPVVNLFAFLALIMFSIFNVRSSQGGDGIGILFLLSFFVCYLVALIRADYSDFFKYLISFFFVVFFLKYSSYTLFDYIQRWSAYFLLVSAFVGVPLYFLGVGYFSHNLRFSGFMFDPNYYAVGMGYSLLYFLILSEVRFKYLFAAVCGLALFATFSKGALLAVLVAIAYWVFVKGNIFRFFILIVVGGVANILLIDIVFDVLAKYELFRVDMGFNLRDIYAELAYEGVLKHPFIGNGIDSISHVISYYGFGNSSFHNYYLEYVYISGIPAFFVFCFALLFSFLKLFFKNFNQSVIFLFFIIVANNFSFAIAGVGLLSLLFTVSAFYYRNPCENYSYR